MYRNLIIALFAAVGTVVSTTAYTKSAKEVFAEVSGGIVVVLAMNARGANIAQGSGVVIGTNEVVTKLPRRFWRDGDRRTPSGGRSRS